MSEYAGRYFVASISGATVTLSPEWFGDNKHGGVGCAQIAITTHESTPLAAFWGGAAAACGRFEVIIRKVS